MSSSKISFTKLRRLPQALAADACITSFPRHPAILRRACSLPSTEIVRPSPTCEVPSSRLNGRSAKRMGQEPLGSPSLGSDSRLLKLIVEGLQDGLAGGELHRHIVAGLVEQEVGKDVPFRIVAAVTEEFAGDVRLRQLLSTAIAETLGVPATNPPRAVVGELRTHYVDHPEQPYSGDSRPNFGLCSSSRE